MLHALPNAATDRANDGKFSDNSKKKFASLHLHDLVYNLCPKDDRGNRRLVDSVPAEIARELTRNHDCTFTEADKLADGTYVPLPNVTKSKFVQYVDQLEAAAQQVAETISSVPVRRPTRASPPTVTADQIQNQQLQDDMARQAAQVGKQKSDLQNFEAQLEKRRKELELRERALKESQKDVDTNS